MNIDRYLVRIADTLEADMELTAKPSGMQKLLFNRMKHAKEMLKKAMDRMRKKDSSRAEKIKAKRAVTHWKTIWRNSQFQLREIT